MLNISPNQYFYISNTYILQRKKAPFLASYKITLKCNLRCLQCPFHQMAAQTPSPTYQQVISTLDNLYERGNRIIIFEGGEPSLWHDGEYTIYDVVKAAKERFYCVGMTTNGIQKLDIPVDTLWVSIDGLEKTHNQLRNTDCFSTIIENIQQSTHPRLFAHITVNNRNYLETPELIRFLSGLVKGITIQFYYPYHNQYDLYLDIETRKTLIDELLQMKKHGYPILNSKASLKALKNNTWQCADWLIDNANPDGSISQGCYLKGRDDIDCSKCGFSPHTEISLAYQGNLDAILAGIKIFF